MEEKFDTRQGYCRKLGHHLTFKYCREEHNELPCLKIRDCWFDGIDINHFLSQNYKTEEIEYLRNVPQTKVGTILELIRRAQGSTEQR